MLEPASDGGKSPADRIKAARARLQEAYNTETTEATQPCPLAGGATVPPHAGRCKLCDKTPVDPTGGTVHSIARTAEAIAEVNRLRDEIKATGLKADGADRSKDIPYAAFAADGNMLGVLLCYDPVAKKTVILKSFSGVAGNTGKMDVPGYSPYLATNPSDLYARQVAIVESTTARLAVLKPQPQTQGAKPGGLLIAAGDAVKAEQDRILRANGVADGLAGLSERTTRAGSASGAARKTLGKKTAELAKARSATGDPAQQAARDARVVELERELAAAQTDADEKAAALSALQAQKPVPSKLTARPADTADALDKLAWAEIELKNEVKQLEQQRKAAEKARDAANDKMQVPNFAGKPASDLAAICIDEHGATRVRAGTCGQCAAPKLLAEAHAKGLTPISLAETWLGGAKGSQQEGPPVESCENCRSFIGAAVCGLHEKQKEEMDTIDAGATP